MRLRAEQQHNLWQRLVGWIKNSPPLRYPDLGLICLGLFVELVGVGAVVPVRSIYAREHGATMAEIGFMASGFLLGQFLLQLPGGWASDKWGRKPLLVGGVAIAGLISFLFLLNDQPWYFIALRFVEGAAGGAIAPAANAYVIDAVPVKERGAAFGWVGSAFSAGFMLGPAIGGVMSDWFGYTAPFLFGGTMALITALFLAAKMTNRRPGDTVIEVEKESETSGEAETKSSRTIPKNLFLPALLGALVIVITAGFADGLFISIWPIWLKDLNASNSYIGLTYIIFSLPVMLLMPTTGRMADKYRLLPLIVIPNLLLTLIYFTYGFTSDLFIILLLGLMEGALIAVMGPALGKLTANLSPDDARGRLQGLVSTVRTVAGFVSSILVAILYGMSMSYPFFMLAGVQVGLIIVGGLVLWQAERRNRLATNGVSTEQTITPTGGAMLEDAAK